MGCFGDPFFPFFPQKATALPAKRAEYFDSSEPVQNRLYKSLKVWSMLADLEESLGTFQVRHLGMPWGTWGQLGTQRCCSTPGWQGHSREVWEM